MRKLSDVMRKTLKILQDVSNKPGETVVIQSLAEDSGGELVVNMIRMARDAGVIRGPVRFVRLNGRDLPLDEFTV